MTIQAAKPGHGVPSQKFANVFMQSVPQQLARWSLRGNMLSKSVVH
jgi:hypothetical protein